MKANFCKLFLVNYLILFIVEKEMEHALFLLPYIMQVPLRCSKRPSNEEAAFHFIQFHPASVELCTVYILCLIIMEKASTVSVKITPYNYYYTTTI